MRRSAPSLRPAGARAKARVAVVAHSGKTFGGGLEELRAVLARAGHVQPLWFEVPKSSDAKRAVRRAVKKGATVLFAWGGDGLVQRCVNALAGTGVSLAIVPAGTANLLATNLGIPRDIAKAVRIGLGGKVLPLDVGVVNGERFAVMAGTGLDALIMSDVSHGEKERLGRVAYLRSGLKALRANRVRAKIRVDGALWFEGKASNVLVGNVGTIVGGLKVFPDASATDGKLEVGVVTAKTTWQWLRVLSRVAVGHLERSPYVQTTQGKKISIRLGHKAPYELDGGARPPARRLEVRVERGAINVCAPARAASKRPAPAPRAARKPEPAVPPAAPVRADREPSAGDGIEAS
jgi:diacylglycerol kinase (ATP)